MNEFIAKHAEGIAGVLSGFDRLAFPDAATDQLSGGDDGLLVGP